MQLAFIFWAKDSVDKGMVLEWVCFHGKKWAVLEKYTVGEIGTWFSSWALLWNGL